MREQESKKKIQKLIFLKTFGIPKSKAGILIYLKNTKIKFYWKLPGMIIGWI
jgi:hypothetical protein